MLENNPYYLEKEMQRRTGQTLAAANRDQLAKTIQSSETSDSNGNLNYHQTNDAWWAKFWQKTCRWFRPVNA